MNYKRIYERIINYRISNPVVSGYFERHHIIPKSLGGSNGKENLVALTAKEHFICHLLLTKMYPIGSLQHKKMIRAFMMMKSSSIDQDRYISSSMYERYRQRFSQMMSESQEGSNNSQFGTFWINNPTIRQNRKIPKNQPIPDGWSKGRILKFGAQRFNCGSIIPDEKIKTGIRTAENRISQKDKFTHLYSIYESHSWEEFLQITKYEHSRPNIISQFKRYVDDYEPQNGKKRMAGTAGIEPAPGN